MHLQGQKTQDEVSNLANSHRQYLHPCTPTCPHTRQTHRNTQVYTHHICATLKRRSLEATWIKPEKKALSSEYHPCRCSWEPATHMHSLAEVPQVVTHGDLTTNSHRCAHLHVHPQSPVPFSRLLWRQGNRLLNAPSQRHRLPCASFTPSGLPPLPSAAPPRVTAHVSGLRDWCGANICMLLGEGHSALACRGRRSAYLFWNSKQHGEQRREKAR